MTQPARTREKCQLTSGIPLIVLSTQPARTREKCLVQPFSTLFQNSNKNEQAAPGYHGRNFSHILTTPPLSTADRSALCASGAQGEQDGTHRPPSLPAIADRLTLFRKFGPSLTVGELPNLDSTYAKSSGNRPKARGANKTNYPPLGGCVWYLRKFAGENLGT